MSGMVLIPPAIIPAMQIPTALIAFGMLGFEVVQGAKALVCGRKQDIVDHVLVNESGLRIGVRKNKEGKLELLVDENELRTKEGLELKEFEQQVQQKYAYAELMKRLQAEGYQVVEETEEAEDTVRLVVRRWR